MHPRLSCGAPASQSHSFHGGLMAGVPAKEVKGGEERRSAV